MLTPNLSMNGKRNISTLKFCKQYHVIIFFNTSCSLNNFFHIRNTMCRPSGDGLQLQDSMVMLLLFDPKKDGTDANANADADA